MDKNEELESYMQYHIKKYLMSQMYNTFPEKKETIQKSVEKTEDNERTDHMNDLENIKRDNGPEITGGSELSDAKINDIGEQSAVNEEGEQLEINSDVPEADAIAQNTEAKKKKEPEIACEDEAKRTKNTKHYKMTDGTYRAVMFGEEIHYYDDSEGKYKEINNGFTEETAEDGQGVTSFVNKKGDLTVEIVAETGSGDLIRINKGMHQLSWNFAGKKNTPGAEKNLKGKKAKLNKKIKAEKNQKKKFDGVIEELYNRSKNNDEIIFSDIIQGNDIQCILEKNMLKENIIVREKSDTYEYEFEIKTKNLKAQLKDDGSIEFFLTELSGIGDESVSYNKKLVFTVPAPYMYDSAGAKSDSVSYALSRKNKTYTLTVAADPEWINDQARVFPVTIDPTVIFYEYSAFHDELGLDYLCKGGSEDFNTGKDEAGIPIPVTEHLWFGNNTPNNENGVRKIDIKYSEREDNEEQKEYLFEGGKINHVSFNAFISRAAHSFNPGPPNLLINVHRLNRDGSIGDLTDRFNFADLWPEGYSANFNNDEDVYFTLREEADPDDNTKGPVIFSLDITKETLEYFNGGDCKGIELSIDYEGSRTIFVCLCEPYVVFDYTPKRSIQSSGYDFPAGRAGQGTVDIASGNLLFTHPDVSTGGNSLPVSISHIYNGYNAGEEFNGNMKLGKGWKLNLQQTLIDPNYQTDHNVVNYDYPDHEDPDGYYLSKTLKVYTDANGTEHHLTKRYFYYRPIRGSNVKQYIKDPAHKEREDCRSEISDGNYVFNKLSGGNSKLADREGNSLYFNSDGRLYRIESKDDGANNYIDITYVSSRITEVTNSDGKSASLQYTSNGYLEKISSGSNMVLYNYSDGKLAFIEYQVFGNFSDTIFTYDGNRLASVQDQTGYTLRMSYNNEWVNRVRSVLKCSIYKSIQYNSNNLSSIPEEGWSSLGTTYFEYQPNTTFITNENGVRTGYIIDNSGIVTTTFEDFMTESADGYLDVSNSVTYNGLQVDDNPNDEFTSIISSVSAKTLASAQNYVQNPTFKTNLDKWTKVSRKKDGTQVSGGISQSNKGVHGYSSTACLIEGDLETERKVYQRIYKASLPQMSPGYNIFMLSGWAKGDSKYISKYNEEARFELSATLVYSDGSESKTHTARFDKLNTEWQFAAVPVVIENYNNLNYVEIAADYSYNINECYFDNIRFTPSKGAETKIYENDYSVSETGAFKIRTEFNSKGSPTKVEQTNKRNLRTYTTTTTYDNRQRPLTKQNTAGPNTAYTYDSKGNCTSEKTYKGNLEMYTSTAYSPNKIESYDYRSKKTTYSFDNITDMLTKLETPSGHELQYTHEQYHSLIKSLSTSFTGAYNSTVSSSNTYYYNRGLLTRLTHEGFNYYFRYDGLSRMTHAYLEDKLLVYIEYYKGSAIHGTAAVRTEKVSYANGNTFLYYYDKYDRLVSVRYNDNPISLTQFSDITNELQRFTYNAGGLLSTYTDKAGDITHNYTYDDYGKLLTSTQKDISVDPNKPLVTAGVIYDEYDRAAVQTIKLENNQQVKYSYSYGYIDNPDLLRYLSIEDEYHDTLLEYNYDSLNRLTLRALGGINNSVITEKYTYLASGTRTTPLIASIERLNDDVTQSKLQYTYDDEGNITEVRNAQGVLTHKYWYDKMNRLVREDIPGSKIVLYNYDSKGNITFRKEYTYTTGNAARSINELNALTPSKQYAYSYNTSGYEKNRLISFNGKTLPEKETLNPLEHLDGYPNERAALRMSLMSVRGGSGNTGSGSTGSGSTGSGNTGSGNTGSGGTGSGSQGGSGSGSGSGSGGTGGGETPKVTGKYDANGNPNYWFKTVDGVTTVPYELFWKKGRQLMMVKEGSQYYNYKYNADGIRIRKNANGITYTYFLDDSGNLIGEKRVGPGVNIRLTYEYDATGILAFGFSDTITGQRGKLYYQKNLQGDIIGINWASGVTACIYDYDAWGNVILKSGDQYILSLNRILYRSYYQDIETGWYYLQSRYYDPSICRFINADSISYLEPESLTELNLYTYCANNPVMCIDPTGHALLSIIGGIFIGSLITQLLTSILGAQIAGGLGSVGLGASSIAVGTSMFAFGPMGILTGSIMIAAGIFSILGGTSEIGEGLTGYNFMIDGMGMNRGVYDVAYAVSGMISTIGSIGAYVTRGKISDRMLDSILTDPNKINNYSIKRFKAVAKYSSWKTGPLTQSSQGKVGFKALHPKDGIIQWHSTPRHNSGSPYWKVAEGKIGTWKFDYLTGRRIF